MGKSPRSILASAGPGGAIGELSEGIGTTVGNLSGEWVTSYSGWMHFRPLPEREGVSEDEFKKRLSKFPPLIGGKRWIPPEPTAPPNSPGTYEQREGYFVFSALMCLKFEGDKLNGVVHMNRGGGLSFVSSPLTGSYSLTFNEPLNIVEGNFKTSHKNTGGIVVENRYLCIVRSADEIDWVWAGGVHRIPHHEIGFNQIEEPFRALVTHGTLRRAQSA